MLKHLARAAILTLALATAAAAETVTIRNEGGGNVSEHIRRRAALAEVDQVRIVGMCFSSCTIFTTLPNACVMPDARIGFHGTTPRVPLLQKYLDMRLGRFYRGEVRRLYETTWRHIWGTGSRFVVTGRKLKQLDPLIRLCR
jgi:hypothetical protein